MIEEVKREKPGSSGKLSREEQRNFDESIQKISIRTDRMFSMLLIAEWICGILCAFVFSPRAWAGSQSKTHIHIYAAVFLGAAIIHVYKEDMNFKILRFGESMSSK